ncbi:beta strand repeat-containing protein, partial [Magnetococcales bacterium HHB-1]
MPEQANNAGQNNNASTSTQATGEAAQDNAAQDQEQQGQEQGQGQQGQEQGQGQQGQGQQGQGQQGQGQQGQGQQGQGQQNQGFGQQTTSGTTDDTTGTTGTTTGTTGTATTGTTTGTTSFGDTTGTNTSSFGGTTTSGGSTGTGSGTIATTGNTISTGQSSASNTLDNFFAENSSSIDPTQNSTSGINVESTQGTETETNNTEAEQADDVVSVDIEDDTSDPTEEETEQENAPSDEESEETADEETEVVETEDNVGQGDTETAETIGSNLTAVPNALAEEEEENEAAQETAAAEDEEEFIPPPDPEPYIVETDENLTSDLDTSLYNAIEVKANATLTMPAAKNKDLPISGQGTTALTNAEQTLSENFSHVTTDGFSVQFDGDGTFNGSFPTGTIVKVSTGNTLTIAADIISGYTASGAGVITITDIDATPAADFSNITVTTTTLSIDTDTTFTGTLPASAKVVATNGTTFTADSAIATGKTLENSGAGDATITLAQADANGRDFSNLSNTGSGNLTLSLTESGDYSGITGLNSFTSVTTNGGGVELASADVSTLAISFTTTTSTDDITIALDQADASSAGFISLTKAGTGKLLLKLSGTGDYSGINGLSVFDSIEATGNGIVTLASADVTGGTLTFTTASSNDNVAIELAQTDASSVDFSNLNEAGAGALKLVLTDTGDYSNINGLDNFTQIVFYGSGTASLASADISGKTFTIETFTANDVANITLTQSDASSADFSSLTHSGSGEFHVTFTDSGSFSGITGLSKFSTINLTGGEATLTSNDVSDQTFIINGATSNDNLTITLAQTDANTADFSGLSDAGSSGALNITFSDSGDYSGVTGLGSFDTANLKGNGVVTLASDDVNDATLVFNGDTTSDDVTVTLNQTDASTTNFSNLSKTGSGDVNLTFAGIGDYSGIQGLDSFDTINTDGSGDVTVASADVTGKTVSFTTNDTSDAVLVTLTQANASSANFSSVTKTGSGNLKLSTTEAGDYSGITGLANFNAIYMSGGNEVSFESAVMTGQSYAIKGNTANDDLSIALNQADASTANFSSLSNTGSGQFFLTFSQTGDYTGINGLDNFDEIKLVSGSGNSVASADITGKTVVFNGTAAGDDLTVTLTQANANSADFSNISETGSGDLILNFTDTGSFTGINGLNKFSQVSVTGGAITLTSSDVNNQTLDFNVSTSSDNATITLTQANASSANFTNLSGSGSGSLDITFSDAGDYSGVTGLGNFATANIDGNGAVTLASTDVTNTTLAFKGTSTNDDVTVTLAQANASGSNFTNLTNSGSGNLDITFSDAGNFSGVTGLGSFATANINGNGAVTLASADVNNASLAFNTNATGDVVGITLAQADAAAANFSSLSHTGNGKLNLDLSATGDYSGIQGLDKFSTINLTSANGDVTVASADVTGKTVSFTTDDASDAVLITLAQTDVSSVDFSNVTETGTGNLKLSTTGTGDYSGITGLTNFDAIYMSGGGEVSFAASEISGQDYVFKGSTADDDLSISLNQNEASSADFSAISNTGSGQFLLTFAETGDYSGVNGLDKFDEVKLTSGSGNTVASADVSGKTVVFNGTAAGDDLTITLTQTAANTADFSNISETGSGDFILNFTDTGSFTGITGLNKFVQVSVTGGAASLLSTDVNNLTLEFKSTAASDDVTITLAQANASGSDFSNLTSSGTGNLDITFSDAGNFSGVTGLGVFDTANIVGNSAVTLASADVNNATLAFNTNATGDVVGITLAQGDAATANFSNISHSGNGALNLDFSAVGDYSGIQGLEKFATINASAGGTVTVASTDVAGKTVSFTTAASTDIVDISLAQTAASGSVFTNVTETGDGSMTLTFSDTGSYTGITDMTVFSSINVSGGGTATLASTDVTGKTLAFATSTASDILDISLAQTAASGSVFTNVTETGDGSMTLTFSDTGNYSGVTGLENFSTINASAGGTVTVDSTDVAGKTVSFTTAAATDIVDISLAQTAANGSVFTNVSETGDGSMTLTFSDTGSYTGITDMTVFSSINVSGGGTATLASTDVTGKTLAFATSTASDILDITLAQTAANGSVFTNVTETGDGSMTL